MCTKTTIIRMRYFSILWLLALLVFINISCSRKSKIDTDTVILNQEFKYFHEDLFAISPDQIWDNIDKLEEKYPVFFNVFNHAVISIGGTNQFDYDRKLARFITNPDIISAYSDVNKLFKPFPYKNEITNSFKRYKYLFPDALIPDIYTHISGFNQSIVVDSAYLSISLDKYLGSDSKYYYMLRTQNYLKQTMYPDKIPTDVMWAWISTEFQPQDNKKTLLSEMIYYGKLYYLMYELFPDTPDSIVWGMPAEKLKWCSKNEKYMWMYLIEHKQLYSSQYKDIIRYIDNGPFTSCFSQESPARTGQWLGYRIVNSYMQKNKGVTIQQLFENNNAQDILQTSKYKP